MKDGPQISANRPPSHFGRSIRRWFSISQLVRTSYRTVRLSAHHIVPMGRPKTIATGVVSILVVISILHQLRQFHQDQYRALQQRQELMLHSRDDGTTAAAPKTDSSSWWSVIGTGNTTSSTTPSTPPSSSTTSATTSTSSSLLLPWEIQSAMPARLCAPPHGIPKYCCLGSISNGGAVTFNPRSCRLNVSDYDIASYTEQFVPHLRHGMVENDELACDVCDIVEMVRSNNLTLSFVGDSMTRQTFAGLECEIRKRLYDQKNVVVTITQPVQLYQPARERSSCVAVRIERNDDDSSYDDHNERVECGVLVVVQYSCDPFLCHVPAL
jgi:hypothetical protein